MNEIQLKVNEVKPQKVIWNIEEIKASIDDVVKKYDNIVFDDEKIKEAKQDRAELNKLAKNYNEQVKIVTNAYTAEINAFKSEIQEIFKPVLGCVSNIDAQIKKYEEQQRELKIAEIKSYFEDCKKIMVNDLNRLAFEDIFEHKWANASTSKTSWQSEIKSIIDKINEELEILKHSHHSVIDCYWNNKRSLPKALQLKEQLRQAEEIAKEKLRKEAEEKARKEAEELAKTEKTKNDSVQDILLNGINNSGITNKNIEEILKKPDKVLNKFNNKCNNDVCDIDFGKDNPFAIFTPQKTKYNIIFETTKENYLKIIKFIDGLNIKIEG